MDRYYEYQPGEIDIQVTRVDERVSLCFYRGADLLIRVDTNRSAAMDIATKIIGVMK